jgi:hypothetical protein
MSPSASHRTGSISVHVEVGDDAMAEAFQREFGR